MELTALVGPRGDSAGRKPQEEACDEASVSVRNLRRRVVAAGQGVDAEATAASTTAASSGRQIRRSDCQGGTWL